jgi:7-keto-8-aminopelargonate synthetase-like enzyme
VFPHKDVDAARKIAKELPANQRKLIITDGVFSMDGDLGVLPALCDVAEEYGCIMMVDDAHASGVFGKNGRGTIDHFNMHGRVDIQVGTLSKAIGALGGYVAGSHDLIDFLHHRARPFCSRRRIRRRWPLRVWPRWTSWRTSRRSSSGSGTTRASSRRAWRRWASTPASARVRSRP